MIGLVESGIENVILSYGFVKNEKGYELKKKHYVFHLESTPVKTEYLKYKVLFSHPLGQNLEGLLQVRDEKVVDRALYSILNGSVEKFEQSIEYATETRDVIRKWLNSFPFTKITNFGYELVLKNDKKIVVQVLDSGTGFNLYKSKNSIDFDVKTYNFGHQSDSSVFAKHEIESIMNRLEKEQEDIQVLGYYVAKTKSNMEEFLKENQSHFESVIDGFNKLITIPYVDYFLHLEAGHHGKLHQVRVNFSSTIDKFLNEDERKHLISECLLSFMSEKEEHRNVIIFSQTNGYYLPCVVIDDKYYPEGVSADLLEKIYNIVRSIQSYINKSN